MSAAKPAHARTEIERKVLDAAGRAQAKPFRTATILGDGAGSYVMVVIECAPDGRWRELRRSDATGLRWAETQLADELHGQRIEREREG